MKNLPTVNFKSITKILAPKTLAFLISFLLSPLSFFSQAPAIEWQNTIGGNQQELFGMVVATSDGGSLLGGQSYSNISGDKTENKLGSADYWVVKLNSSGAIEWQNTIGGNQTDYLMSLEQTSDGGYILGGYSSSGVSGDKSEPKVNGGMFSHDYWIVKINSIGNIEWQNTIGSNEDDYLQDITQTPDGGYLIGGYTLGGISGEKTEASIGLNDFWIIKLNEFGVIEWQNTIGGTEDDECNSVSSTDDGGYIIGGHSESGISGDKTESGYGYKDYWLLKLDNSGSIEWENTIGGDNDDILSEAVQTTDGGYILSGNSGSDISGDKSEMCRGDRDFWAVKLDVSGTIVWQKTVGGNDIDACVSVEETADGGFILGGTSESDISGEKTEVCRGSADYYVVKLSVAGDLEWEKTIGGSDYEREGPCRQTTDGGYIVAGHSYSQISGDKTESRIGSSTDYWAVKLFPDVCAIPSGLFTNNITTTKATAHWDIIPGADSYQIWYRPIGAGTWTKKLAPTNLKTIKPLIPDTDYEYQVRAECSDGDFGAFTALQYFSTLPLRTELKNVNMEMVIYPNPNTGSFKISAEISSQKQNSETLQIQIFDITGKLIYSQQNKFINGIFNEDIHLESIPTGIYILKCFSENSFMEEKIMIE